MMRLGAERAGDWDKKERTPTHNNKRVIINQSDRIYSVPRYVVWSTPYFGTEYLGAQKMSDWAFLCIALHLHASATMHATTFPRRGGRAGLTLCWLACLLAHHTQRKREEEAVCGRGEGGKAPGGGEGTERERKKKEIVCRTPYSRPR